MDPIDAFATDKCTLIDDCSLTSAYGYESLDECMSSEKAASKSTQTFIIDSEDYEFEQTTQKKKNNKVDINLLMDKVREEKKREKKENLIFVSLIASVILITGAIASF